MEAEQRQEPSKPDHNSMKKTILEEAVGKKTRFISLSDLADSGTAKKSTSELKQTK